MFFMVSSTEILTKRLIELESIVEAQKQGYEAVGKPFIISHEWVELVLESNRLGSERLAAMGHLVEEHGEGATAYILGEKSLQGRYGNQTENHAMQLYKSRTTGSSI